MPKNFKIDEITLVLIVAILAIVVSIYPKGGEPAGIEAEKITSMILDDRDASPVNGGVVDESKLRHIRGMAYKDFKDSLNIKGDFCIYIEDEKGNVILAKGSSKLNGDGIICRE